MSATTTPPAPATVAAQPPEPLWAKPAVSVYAMTIFIIALGIAYMAKDSSSLTMMMGAAISMGSTVINYWLGSSSGSSKKTDIMATNPPPTPVPAVEDPAATVTRTTSTSQTVTPVPSTPTPMPGPLMP